MIDYRVKSNVMRERGSCNVVRPLSRRESSRCCCPKFRACFCLGVILLRGTSPESTKGFKACNRVARALLHEE